MSAELLIRELGKELGVPLELSREGTCRASFDADVLDFEEMQDGHLMIAAELAPATHREDALRAMMAANFLGMQTGAACLSLDEARDAFVLHTELWGEMPYAVFEQRLVLFVQAVRWWKEWLALPPVSAASKGQPEEAALPEYGEADGIAQNVYAPLGSMLRV